MTDDRMTMMMEIHLTTTGFVVPERNGQPPIYRLMSDQTARPIIHQESKS